MSEEKRYIEWETSTMELPDDTSFEGCRDRLNWPSKYMDNDKLFAYDCWKISDHAVVDKRLVSDVLEMYDILLEKGVPNEVESNICQSLGKMVSYYPEIRDDVVELGVKHHPLFEKDLMNYNHLYTEQIESMQGDVKERLDDKNKDILGNLKDKMNFNNADEGVESTENKSKTKDIYLKRDSFEM